MAQTELVSVLTVGLRETSIRCIVLSWGVVRDSVLCASAVQDHITVGKRNADNVVYCHERTLYDIDRCYVLCSRSRGVSSHPFGED